MRTSQSSTNGEKRWNPMTPARIVIVDDSEDFLDAITRYLANKPQFRIVGTMLSAADALLRVPTLKPDLVLIDLMMRSMDGLEATRLLKRLPSPPIVIVMSLHDDPSFRTAARHAGADEFLPKQAFSKQLVPLMERLLPGMPEAANGDFRSS
jgi:DNA-binding NarL/FixJ family response regulator